MNQHDILKTAFADVSKVQTDMSDIIVTKYCEEFKVHAYLISQWKDQSTCLVRWQ